MSTKCGRDLAPLWSIGTVLACAWPALVLATVCLLPFLNKPFVIDDPYFLTMAHQIVRQPAHPMDFTVCWNGPETCAKAYLLTPGDALMGYALVPTILGGAHEWMAHLTQLVLAWIAVVAMAGLILRFQWSRWHAIAGALLLVAIPPFLPMASTAMPDILATTCALVAIERLAAWKSEMKWSQGAVSAVALGLAGFARPHLVLLLPLSAFFLLDDIKQTKILELLSKNLRLYIPVLAGSGLLLAVILAVREHNLAINPPASVVGGHILRNLFSYLLYLVFPLPLGACWIATRIHKGGLYIFVILLAVVVVVFWILPWGQQFVLVLVTIGVCTLATSLFGAWKSRDHIALFLLFWILIPLPVVYYVQLPIKLMLPCVPAVILLCMRLTEGFSLRVVQVASVVLIIVGTCYSLLILHSDAEFASFGRDSLYRLITPHVASGQRVWFGGQYWSYWYAPLAGATLTYPGGPQPQRGDLLVTDVFAGGDQIELPRFPHRTLVEEISHKYRFGRTMGAGACLYTNGCGFWLWGFGDSGQDRYELWRID